jgi:hypothetical protein
MGLGLIKGECMPKELYDLIPEEKKDWVYYLD